MCQNSPYINICGAISKREVKKHGAFKSQGGQVQIHRRRKAGESYSLAQMYIFMRSRAAARAREDFGSLSPLGLAFSAAAGSYALAASVGALVGYLLSFSGTAGIRYMACVAGIALINFSVSRLRGESSARKVAPIASALCCASTGIAVLLVEGFSLNGIVSFLADCVLAGGMTYFSRVRSRLLIKKRDSAARQARYHMRRHLLLRSTCSAR